MAFCLPCLGLASAWFSAAQPHLGLVNAASASASVLVSRKLPHPHHCQGPPPPKKFNENSNWEETTFNRLNLKYYICITVKIPSLISSPTSNSGRVNFSRHSHDNASPLRSWSSHYRQHLFRWIDAVSRRQVRTEIFLRIRSLRRSVTRPVLPFLVLSLLLTRLNYGSAGILQVCRVSYTRHTSVCRERSR